ncbi:MAG: DUF5060 domain-containing protein [Planctomycetes bacterium]|nr:DUF5060 domain-containing protein [Planctomycetota bacterium]
MPALCAPSLRGNLARGWHLHFLAALALSAASHVHAELRDIHTPAGGVRPDSTRGLGRVALNENWQDASTLRFQARRTDPSPQNVWIFASFENALHWRYQTEPQLLSQDGSWNSFSFRFSPASPDWYPSGHARDLDDFALARITGLELSCSATASFPGRIEIRGVSLDRQKPSDRPPKVFDLARPSDDLAAGSIAEIRFRLDRPFQNPFDPEEADVRVRVTDPQQRAFELFAFYDQEYAEVLDAGEKRLVPVGAGQWRSRFRPMLQGLYRYRLVLSGRYAMETPDLALRVGPPSTRGSAGPADRQAIEEMLWRELDRSGSAASIYGSGRWRPEESDRHRGTFPCWNGSMEWGPPRPDCLGLGFYNLAHGFLLDRALCAAESQGERYPLRLFGNEEFHDASSHVDFPLRWSENPYRWRNGGPLARPSELFTSEPALRNLRKLLRYLHARYSVYSSFSHLLIAADFRVPAGPAAWHDQVAAFWNALPIAPEASRPGLLSLHPQANGDEARPLLPGPPFIESPPGHGELRCFAGPDAFDVSSSSTLVFEIELPAHAPPSLRCLLALEDDEGWLYQAMPPLFLRPDDVTRVEFNLEPEGGLEPAGHGRPWSAYSRLNVLRPRMRVYSPEPFDGPILLKRILVVPAAGSPASPPPAQVLNLRLRSLQIPAGQTNEVAFELTRAYADPFDPACVSLDVEVQDPSGKKWTQPAFFYQAYAARAWGEKSIETPEGPLEWRARIPAALPGPYSFRLLLRENYGPASELARAAFNAVPAQPASPGPDTLSEAARRFLITEPDRAYRCLWAWQNGSWSRLASASEQPGVSQVQAGHGPSSRGLWLANLEWSAGWGRGYRGLGKYNLLLACHLDRALAEAEAGGLAFPLRLLGNEEFHEVTVHASFPYRWAENPLNAVQGGPLARPSLFFQEASARLRFKNFLRYVTARYASSRAVSALVLACEMPEAGVEAWHREIGEWLGGLPGPRSGLILSYHPLAGAVDARVHSSPLGFQERAAYDAAAAAAAGRTAGPGAAASGIGPEAGIAPGLEVRAFTQGPAGDWSAFSIARARVELPPDSPADLRALLSLKDEDGWWFEALHPAFLRPGDTTTLLFFLRPGEELQPVGHSRPWSLYTRYRVQDVALRLFSTRPYAGPLRLASFEFLEWPERPEPLQVASFQPAAAEVHAGQVFEIAFSLNRAFVNPFDPAEVDLGVTFRGPSGRTRRVPAFFSQGYARQGDRLVAEGPEHWRVRFRPQEEGRHTFRLDARLGGQEIDLAREGAFTATAPAAAAASRAFDSPALLRLHDLSYAARSQFGPAGWFALDAAGPADTPLWHPVLEWTSRWGKYADRGRYNLEAAWEFDRVLEQAAEAGQSFPLRLNGNMEFFNRRTHRWPDNPLHAANGGPLEAPSQYYQNPKAIALQEQLWRYLLARYGELPAVSDAVLAADLPAEGAEAWHDRAGQTLSQILPPHARLLSFHPQAIPHLKTTVLADFERGTDEFRPETGIAGGAETRLSSSPAWASHGGASLAILRSFTGEGEAPLVASIDQDWFDTDTLVLDVKLPADAPHDMRVLVFLKDGDYWYYQRLLDPFLVPGDVTRLLVDLTARTGAWTPPPAPPAPAAAPPWHHSRPWTDTARARIRQIGIRIFGHQPYAGTLYVDHLQLWQTGRARPQGPPQIARLEASDANVGLFEKFELTFSLDRDFRNPFDPDVINVSVRFITPGNETRAVPAFYFQDYERSEIVQPCPEHRKAETFEVLTPKGAPVWKARFTPTQPGVHRYSVSVNGRQAWPPEGTAAFQAVPSDRPGFIRVAADRRHFEFSNGTFFYPVGPNLRSPTDGRNAAAYAGLFEQEWHRQTYLYDRYFEKMREHGLDWARVWQCSWWLGLEWTREWPGYHGLGRYNLENAWRLDHLLESARRAGVYLQIDTTNHGQVSLQIDSEWSQNPLNRNNPVDRGPLQLPREFFSSEAARQAYADRVRYTTARWGYSPNLFGWILMTECEFTDDYWASAAPKEEAGRHPGLVQWHQFAAGLFQNGDPNHLVATHFSHPWRGFDLFATPAVQFIESNTYWQDWKFEQLGGPLGNTPWINHYAYHQMLGQHQKPVLVGEFGGDVYKNPPQQLDIELHIGAWSMAVVPYAGCTGYWWWPWLHYGGRYPALQAVANFMKGEDRRGQNLAQVQPAVTQGLLALGLQGGNRADLWIYHPEVIRVPAAQIPAVTGATITLAGLADGSYEAEVWDTVAGKAVEKMPVVSQQGQLVLPLPNVQGDLAVKLRPGK